MYKYNILNQVDKQLLYQSHLTLIGEMLSMIAHQWRKLLTAISATIGVIEHKAKINMLDNETAQQKTEEISDFSTKYEHNGTGLGLYMSKTIIEGHCGRVLDMTNTAEGAFFRIVLEQRNV